MLETTGLVKKIEFCMAVTNCQLFSISIASTLIQFANIVYLDYYNPLFLIFSLCVLATEVFKVQVRECFFF